MLSFENFGIIGRFGNQLFQYAFLRTQAERLGVKFHCPHWIGDEIFNLNDHDIRVSHATGITNRYVEPLEKDYNRTQVELPDGTDVTGYFESENNFDVVKVRSWYAFKQEKMAVVREKYGAIVSNNSIGLHCRFGDKVGRGKFYCPRIGYYREALKIVDSGEGSVLVFSDDIEVARKFLSPLPYQFVFVQNNEYWEDFYILTLCRDFICSPSTFAWWGAWLGSSPEKRIIFPREGMFRPLGPMRNKDLIPDHWVKLQALIPVLDSYPIAGTIFRFKNRARIVASPFFAK